MKLKLKLIEEARAAVKLFNPLRTHAHCILRLFFVRKLCALIFLIYDGQFDNLVATDSSVRCVIEIVDHQSKNNIENEKEEEEKQFSLVFLKNSYFHLLARIIDFDSCDCRLSRMHLICGKRFCCCSWKCLVYLLIFTALLRIGILFRKYTRTAFFFSPSNAFKSATIFLLTLQCILMVWFYFLINVQFFSLIRRVCVKINTRTNKNRTALNFWLSNLTEQQYVHVYY